VPPDYWNFVHGHPGGSKQTRPLLPFEVVHPLLIVDLPNLADLVRLVIVCCCKFGQSPCMTYLYGCQEYFKDTVEHDLF
jgi:hypothetical protein